MPAELSHDMHTFVIRSHIYETKIVATTYAPTFKVHQRLQRGRRHVGLYGFAYLFALHTSLGQAKLKEI
ncbi:UNVERIFIED_CONTAM: hypothetical protein NCL1_36907 [Trichonephila clavipes]